MTELSKLKWHCRRGIKELDFVLSRYLDNDYLNAPASEQTAFKELLEFEDPSLFAMLLGDMQADSPEQSALLLKLAKLDSESVTENRMFKE